jgi:hypothetical protein
MRLYILDAEHRPIPVFFDDPRFTAQFGDSNARRVASTQIGPYTVSTVFLSIDHAWCGGEPVLFETLVFRCGWEAGDWGRRYHTWEEAAAGHAAICEKVRAVQQ